MDHLSKLQVGKADIIAGNDLVPRPQPCISGHAAHFHTLHKNPRLLWWPLANAVRIKGELSDYICLLHHGHINYEDILRKKIKFRVCIIAVSGLSAPLCLWPLYLYISIRKVGRGFGIGLNAF